MRKDLCNQCYQRMNDVSKLFCSDKCKTNFELGIRATTKQCTVCNRVRPVEDYYRRHDTGDGLYGRCKDCMRTRNATIKKEKDNNEFINWNETAIFC